MLLIANVYLMNPATKEEKYTDILIQDDCIVKMEENLFASLSKDKDIEVLDATGLIAAPGLVDVHAHFRDPGLTYKEDIETGAKAAMKGGYTSIVLMANTKPCVDSVEILQYVLEKGKETPIHIYSCATITEGMKGQTLVDMKKLLANGAVGFTDDGVPVLDEALCEKAMMEAQKFQVPLSFHEEDPAYIGNNGINKGKASGFYKIEGSDRLAEICMVERDLKLCKQTNACIDIQHVSSKEAVSLIREAKKNGVNVHAEATPHHFTLTEDAVIQYGTYGKMNPPLREETDRIAIIEGLRDGTIDLIATDHAPHSEEEKKKPITEAPSGIIGLETALALGVTYLVETGELNMMSLLEKMTINPARMYGLNAGDIKPNGPADLVLFDPKQQFYVDWFASKSSNSPFRGWQLNGCIKYTICKGKIVYRNA